MLAHENSTKNQQLPKNCKLNKFSSKNMSKLTFDLSSSQSDSDSQDIAHSTNSRTQLYKLKAEVDDIKCASSGRLKKLRSFKKNNKKINFNSEQDNEDDGKFEEVIRLQMPQKMIMKKNKSQQESRRNKAKFFDLDQNQYNTSKGQLISPQEQIKYRNIKNKDKQKSVKTSNLLIFENSQSQDKQQIQEQYEDEIKPSQYPFKTYNMVEQNPQEKNCVNIKNKLFADQENQISNNDEVQSQNLDEHPTMQDQIIINIYRPPEHVRQLSQNVIQKLCSFQNFDNVKLYMLTPIPQGVIYTFQIHKFEYMFRKQFRFYTNNGINLRLHTIASISNFNVDQSVFQIKISNNGETGHENLRDAGKLISNFKRQKFTLYCPCESSKPSKDSQIVCTIVHMPNFFGLSAQDIYTPSVQGTKIKKINVNTVGKDLKKLYDLKQFDSQIKRFRTHKLPNRQLDVINDHIKLSKNTTRHGVVKDQRQKNIFSIVKMQHNRFQISAVHPLAPIQIFSYGIVHIS